MGVPGRSSSIPEEHEHRLTAAKCTLRLNLQSSETRHTHALLGRGHVEHDSPELLRGFFRSAEVQLH